MKYSFTKVYKAYTTKTPKKYYELEKVLMNSETVHVPGCMQIFFFFLNSEIDCKFHMVSAQIDSIIINSTYLLNTGSFVSWDSLSLSHLSLSFFLWVA